MRVLLLLFIVFVLTSCESKNPCKDLKDGVYVYPDLPPNNNMTPEQKKSFLDIPKDVAGCISTEGLILSVLNHPAMGLIFAYNDGQTGYEAIKNQFNGLEIIESRDDRGQALLSRYQTWDPFGFDTSWSSLQIGNYMAKGTYLELLINQYVNLESLNSTDFKSLFDRTLEIYDSKKLKYEFYGSIGMEYCTSILARMMYLKSYEPFISLYQSNGQITQFTDLIEPTASEVMDQIHNIAVSFFDTLQ